GYLSGSTSTSAWKAYENGERTYCGHTLPEGMKKNEAFPQPLITPTTKSDEHDEKISAEEIVRLGLATAEEWEQLEKITFALFARGQELAKKGGLILVDTKYEFGKDEQGNIILIDEIHTSDSSRFWKADIYESRLAAGQEPENFDKEFLRLWYTERCDPYSGEPLPEMPDEFRIEVALRYIETYERITGQSYVLPEGEVKERVEEVLKRYL
ncbi:MAG: phosphoribosylaminoimidazolesuccinocarboxamide synthase, partial [Candidatus Gracilibacteria bacterium]|nr:phosphoribosylaminoimidazolesuccinocarboxamide synthase [Candidatus Gracilibacteria bacterium]